MLNLDSLLPYKTFAITSPPASISLLQGIAPYMTPKQHPRLPTSSDSQLRTIYPNSISSFTFYGILLPTYLIKTSPSTAYTLTPNGYFTLFQTFCTLRTNPTTLQTLSVRILAASTQQSSLAAIFSDYLTLIIISYSAFSLIPLFIHCFLHFRRR